MIHPLRPILDRERRGETSKHGGSDNGGGHDYATTNVLKLLSLLDPLNSDSFSSSPAQSLFRPVTKRGGRGLLGPLRDMS